MSDVPERSRTWSGVAALIEITGVVSGEYGRSEALERKISEISDWNDDEDECVREFAKLLETDLQRQIVYERQRGDEELALRKYRYGDRDAAG